MVISLSEIKPSAHAGEKKLRIGIVCPYGWDVPGGVQVHIKELAEYFIADGHHVSVLAPVSDEEAVLEPWLVSAGRPLAIPFNGSVARVLFGPIAASRVRQWISSEDFDVLHLHEPGIPSLSLLACWAAEGPMVGTFHASTPRMRAIAAAGGLIEPMIEKLGARIAVSEMALQTMTSLYGTSAVIIPNGIDYAKYRRIEEKAPSSSNAKMRIGFLGRFEEERKGLSILLKALPTIVKKYPQAELLVAGPGDSSKILEQSEPSLRKHLTFLGRLDDQEKVDFLRSLQIYVAPNTGGESFGIILAEAMAAGAAVVASDIPAFAALLDNGAHGLLFPNEDSTGLARAVISLLADPRKLSEYSQSGIEAAKSYDWNSVAMRIMGAYETAMAGNGKVRVGSESATWKRGR